MVTVTPRAWSWRMRRRCSAAGGGGGGERGGGGGWGGGGGGGGGGRGGGRGGGEEGRRGGGIGVGAVRWGIGEEIDRRALLEVLRALPRVVDAVVTERHAMVTFEP